MYRKTEGGVADPRKYKLYPYLGLIAESIERLSLYSCLLVCTSVCPSAGLQISYKFQFDRTINTEVIQFTLVSLAAEDLFFLKNILLSDCSFHLFNNTL